jgi:hypothetical protein
MPLAQKKGLVVTFKDLSGVFVYVLMIVVVYLFIFLVSLGISSVVARLAGLHFYFMVCKKLYVYQVFLWNGAKTWTGTKR